MPFHQPAHLGRRGLLAGCAALAVGGLVGCKDDASSGATASPRTTPRSTPSGSTSATPKASTTPTVKPSKNLDAIKVTGAYGKTPKVSVKAPWAIDKTQAKVIKASKGRKVVSGGMVEVNYYAVDGRTGKKFDDSWSRGQPAYFSLAGLIPGFNTALAGQRVGSRVLLGITSKDGYDTSGGNAQAGINVGDSLLFVVDVIDAQLTGPEGTKVTPKKGLPEVTDSKGVPSIKVPKSDPPTSLVVQPLIQGKGKKVGKTDQVTTNYLGVDWATGKTVFNSYGQQSDTSAVNETLAGLTKALVGQKVGSRLLVVVPPKLGYPDGNASPKVDKGTTLVFVVDLLFTAPPQQQ